MVLSDRLGAAADMVGTGAHLADVGTDHGFVPISLVLRSRIPSAIAMDVKEGPLQRARAHIREAGLEAFIQTRLSDGLEALLPGEADSVLIAGMGGALTVRILQKNPPEDLGIRELILQPQSELGKVRKHLCCSGWRIDREDMVLEDGKYYPMMHCRPGEMTLTDIEEEYGPLLIREHHPVLLKYLQFQEEVLERNLDQMRDAESERACIRRQEIEASLRRVRELHAQLRA